MNNPLWIYVPPVVVLAIAAMGAPFWGFFLFLRFFVSIFAGISFFRDSGNHLWCTLWLVIFIIFNPFIKMAAPKGIWQVVDVLAALCWLVRIGWEFRSDFRGFFRKGGG